MPFIPPELYSSHTDEDPVNCSPISDPRDGQQWGIKRWVRQHRAKESWRLSDRRSHYHAERLSDLYLVTRNKDLPSIGQSSLLSFLEESTAHLSQSQKIFTDGQRCARSLQPSGRRLRRLRRPRQQVFRKTPDHPTNEATEIILKENRDTLGKRLKRLDRQLTQPYEYDISIYPVLIRDEWIYLWHDWCVRTFQADVLMLYEYHDPATGNQLECRTQVNSNEADALKFCHHWSERSTGHDTSHPAQAIVQENRDNDRYVSLRLFKLLHAGAYEGLVYRQLLEMLKQRYDMKDLEVNHGRIQELPEGNESMDSLEDEQPHCDISSSDSNQNHRTGEGPVRRFAERAKLKLRFALTRFLSLATVYATTTMPFSEPALEAGKVRVRWTCVSISVLIDFSALLT